MIEIEMGLQDWIRGRLDSIGFRLRSKYRSTSGARMRHRTPVFERAKPGS